MDRQKITALETLAEKLGKLEDDAFHLDQGRIYFLIARARNEVQALVLEAHEHEIQIPAAG